jgi:hypothetical protein
MTAYSNTGPWNNNALPSISATFLNNVESFLDLLTSSAAQDVNVTSNGSGLLTITGLTVSGAVTLNGAGTGLTVAHNATITGTFTVTGDATFNGAGQSITAAHNISVGGTLNLGTGSLTKIASFSGVAGTSPTFFNHNLGVVPDLVLLTVAGATSGAYVVVYDPGTMTTSQVKITAGSGGLNFVGLAIKF